MVEGELHVIIDKNLLRALRRIAIEKFGKMKGALSLAVEEAIETWVKAHSTAHTQIRANKIPGVTGRRLRRILEGIIKLVGDGDGEIEVPANLVRKLIIYNAGVRDPRSISRYMKMLIEEYLVEPNGRKVILYLDRIREVLS